MGVHVIKLYDHPLSGNCYKVRLLLSNLGVPYERVHVDIFAGEQHSERFRMINPCGKIPVLIDGDFTIRESNAILLYLGNKYHPNRLYSREPEKFGRIVEWLFFGKTTIDPSLAVARFILRFLPEEKRDYRQLENLKQSAVAALGILDAHLSKFDFLAGSYSIADIGCYPYVETAPEGGIDLSPFKHVVRWCERIKNEEGYVPIYDAR
jgi:glutathione S-transferase